MALFFVRFLGEYTGRRCIQVQDITKESIDIIIKASESAVSQAVDFAMKTDEINKRLIKSNFKQHIVTCAVFALIMIFTAGFYFIGYTDYPDYPKEDILYVEENQGDVPKDILQTAKAKKIEECETDGNQQQRDN